MLLWSKGVELYRSGNAKGSLRIFERLQPSSKIFFNIACVFSNLNLIEQAIAALTRALEKDQFFSLAYFFRSSCLYSLDIVDEALSDTDYSIQYLRGNMYIDYTQLGLGYRLYACVAYFNRGICLSRLGKPQEAAISFKEAARTAERCEGVDLRPISLAASDGLGKQHTRFRMYTFPTELVYAPPMEGVLNSQRKNYLPKAAVAASREENDDFSGFSGRKLQVKTSLNISSPNGGPIPRVTSSHPIRTVRGARASGFESLDDVGYADDSMRYTNDFSVNNNGASVGSLRRQRSNSTQENTFRYTINQEKQQNNQYAESQTASILDDILSDINDKSDSNAGPMAPPPGAGKAGRAQDQSISGKVSSSLAARAGKRSTDLNLPNSQSSMMQPRNQVRIKLFWRNEIHILSTPSELTYDTLIQKIKRKIHQISNKFSIYYKDEDGDMIKICDDESLIFAFQSSRTNPEFCGRVNIWCRE